MSPQGYARWIRCDIHVHTPFDKEKAFGEDTDRACTALMQGDDTAIRRIASKYFDACRASGLSLVGVTDHNGCAGHRALAPFWAELNSDAAAKGEATVAFLPGAEVTVGSERPVHILLLFDEMTPHDDIDRCINLVFGVGERFDPATGSPRAAGRTVPQFLATVRDYCQPAGGERALSYAVVPAHCQGESGLIRELRGSLKRLVVKHQDWNGFQVSGDWGQERDFREMLAEWIAAKRGRDWSSLTREQKDVFRKMEHWPVIEASDPAKYEDVGSEFVWLKMEVPSLEGLRLALLDPESRLRLRAAGCPACDYPLITSIRVQNSELFDDVYLNLSPQLNTLIGGRGTGKTSLLEYARHGLDRAKPDDFIGQTETMRAELRQFLGLKPERGRAGDAGTLLDDYRITLGLRVANADYVVVRDKTGHSIFQDGQQLPPEDIDLRTLIEPTIMSQREMASIARDPEAQRLVVDSLVRRTIRSECAAKRKAALESLEMAQRARDLLLTETSALGPLRTQLRQVRGLIDTLGAPGREETLDAMERVANVQNWLVKADAVLARVSRRVLETADEVKDEITTLPTMEVEAGSWLSGVQDDVIAALGALETQLRDLAKGPVEFASDLARGREKEWDPGAQKAVKAYEELTSTLAEEGVDLSQRSGLSERRLSLEEQVGSLERDADGIKAKLLAVEDARNALFKAAGAITRARTEVAAELAVQQADVAIDVSQLRDDKGLINSRDRWFAGTRMQSKDWETIVRYVLDETGDVQGRLMLVVEALRHDRVRANAEGVSFTAADSRLAALIGADAPLSGYYYAAIARADEANLNQMEAFVPDDRIEAKFRDNDGQMKPIEHGSLGQKSTAILALLLAAGDQPLIIDQPEDDIDNRYVYDVVVSLLRRRKFQRQIIVASHNANIPVNGDAEMIAVLGVQSGIGDVKDGGSIDRRAIKEMVNDVMEGGREAFALRSERYGF